MAIFTHARPLTLFGALVTGALGCAALRGGEEPEPEPVILYGFGDAPSEPPESCKRLGKIEVTRLENKEPPEDKLISAARDQGGNAVAHVRRGGFQDGFLGKEYQFRAVAFRCPSAKPAGSGAASASAAPSGSAAPSASAGPGK